MERDINSGDWAGVIALKFKWVQGAGTTQIHGISA